MIIIWLYLSDTCYSVASLQELFDLLLIPAALTVTFTYKHFNCVPSVLIPSNNLPICTFTPFGNTFPTAGASLICCWAHPRPMLPLLDASIFVCLTLEPLYNEWVYVSHTIVGLQQLCCSRHAEIEVKEKLWLF